MKDLFVYIFDLLKSHSCVILPGVGGFVLNERGASVDYLSGCFMPPSSEVIFNPHLSYNDGLLANMIVERENLTFDKANLFISEKVKEIKKELNERGLCDIEEFGYFSLVYGNVSFTFRKMNVESLGSFGLTKFYFPTIEKSDSLDLKLENNITEKKSSSKMYLVGVAAMLAMIFLFQPVEDKKMNDFASFCPTNVALQVPSQKTVNVEGFYVVFGKYTTEVEANEYKSMMQNILDENICSVGVLTTNNGYMVSSQRFETIEEANSIKGVICEADTVVSSYVIGLLK